MIKGKFNMLVDSAWGSSGKGAISTRLADIHSVENLSGCNYPNAGHTVVDGAIKLVFKVLPSGAALSVIKHRKPTLWIGPGSGYGEKQFDFEIKNTNYAKPDKEWPDNIPDNIIVHERAMVVTAEHAQLESQDGDQSTIRISSTMSGSGAALASKTIRDPGVQLSERIGTNNWKFYEKVWNALSNGNAFLHEVSQGFALSINSGTHYPFCTSRECTPQQACADFGISPSLVGDVYLNVRSFPIRVGNNFDSGGNMIGYSGDAMHDQKELTWEQIAEAAEFPNDAAKELAETERTTVTKKIRRAFTPSWELLKFSARFCGATKLVLNFPHYIHWSAYKARGGGAAMRNLNIRVRTYIDKMEDTTNLPVVLIGTGPEHDDFILV